MNRDVLLRIKGLHTLSDEDCDDVETKTEAQYFEKNGNRYLLYEEKMEGFQDLCKSRIKFSDHKMEITKNGIVRTSMCFEEHKTCMTEYKTPYGSFPLAVHTKRMSVDENIDHMVIIVEYMLEVNEEPLSDCKIEIEISDRP